MSALNELALNDSSVAFVDFHVGASTCSALESVVVYRHSLNFAQALSNAKVHCMIVDKQLHRKTSSYWPFEAVLNFGILVFFRGKRRVTLRLVSC